MKFYWMLSFQQFKTNQCIRGKSTDNRGKDVDIIKKTEIWNGGKFLSVRSTAVSQMVIKARMFGAER